MANENTADIKITDSDVLPQTPGTPRIHPDAWSIAKTGDDTWVTEIQGKTGTRRTFAQTHPEEVVIPPFTKESQRRDIIKWIDELEGSKVPLQIRTASDVIEENLFLALNKRQVRPDEQNWDKFEGTALEVISIVAYAQGTGIKHPLGEFGIVGHRDLVVCRDIFGTKYIYTDHKLSPDDYLPQQEAGWKISQKSIERFTGGAIAIARDRPLDPQEFDPYKVGVGSLMQAAAVGWIIRHDINNIQTHILTEDGTRMWEKFGLQTTNPDGYRHLDTDIAYPEVIHNIYSHVR